MPSFPSAEDMARSEIALMTQIFTETRDPAAAWRAFSLARRHNLVLPASVATEIDRFADEVGRIALVGAWTRHATANATRAVFTPSEKIGRIWKGHKGRNAGMGAFLAYRGYKLALAVEHLRRTSISSADAVTRVCALKGVSKTTVESAMKKHRHLRHMGDDELRAARSAVPDLLEDQGKIMSKKTQRGAPIQM